MKRSDILRRLNNINIQIGKLMAAQDSAIRTAYANTKGHNNYNASNSYAVDVKKFISNYLSGRKEDYDNGVTGGGHQTEKAEMLKLLAAGYGDEMISEFENAAKTEKDPNIKNDLKRAIGSFKKAMAKRESLMSEKYGKEFERSVKRNEGANNPNDYKRRLIIITAVCLIVAVIAAVVLGPSLLSSIREAGASLMRGDLSIGEKLISILKAAASIAAIAVPLGFGLYFLYHVITFDKLSEGQKNMAVECEYVAGEGFEMAIEKLSKELAKTE